MRYETSLAINILLIFIIGMIVFGSLALFSPDTLKDKPVQAVLPYKTQPVPVYPTTASSTQVAVVTARKVSAQDPALATILETPSAESWYIDVYQPSPPGDSIKITTTTREPGPIVLYVNSYESVTWDLVFTKAVPLAAIVISGYKPGHVINVPPETKVFYVSDTSTDAHNGDYSTVSTHTRSRAYQASAIQLPGGRPEFITL